MAKRQAISDRQLAVAITLSAAALAITVGAPLWQDSPTGQPATPGMGVGDQLAAGPGVAWSTIVAASRPDLAGGAWAPASPGGEPGSSLGHPMEGLPAVPAVEEVRAERPLAVLLPRQVLAPGCCPGAWWSDDSRELLYYDQRSDTGTTAVFGVALWPPAAEPRAVYVKPLLAGDRYQVHLGPGKLEVEDPARDERWTLPIGKAPFLISPDGSRVVWWAARDEAEASASPVAIWASDIKGQSARRVLDLWGAHVLGFHPDNVRILMYGRSGRERAQVMLLLLDTQSGGVEVLATAKFLDGAVLSPSGEWVAYVVSLDRESPEANGVWAASTVTGQRRRLPVDAAYRWRDGHRLVYIPMGNASWHDVWQLDAVTGETQRLIEGRSVSLRVANNDWSLSPDGHTLAFVAEQDRSTWVIDLPPD